MAHAAHRARLFRGWWVVGAALVAQVFGVGPVVVYTIGVFTKPLAQAFASNRASIALGVSVLDVVITLSAPAVGWLADAYGARRVIGSGVIGLAACLCALAFVEPPLWHLYALFAVAGLAGVATVPVTYSRVVANWFDRQRGLALGVASTGVGLGAIVTPSLAQFLIARGSWRSAYLGLGVASLVVAAPVVVAFLRGRPEEVGLLPDGDSLRPDTKAMDDQPGLSVREALRTRTLWQLCFIFACLGGCVNATMSQLVPFLTDQGVSGRAAALATSAFGLASIIGRTGSGYLVDRFFAPRVAGAMFSGAALGVALLLNGAIGPFAFVASGLLGLAMGAESDVMPFLISRYFGMRSMAKLLGIAFASYTGGTALGRFLFTSGFDRTGSYRLSLACALGVLVVAILVTLMLGPYSVEPRGRR